MQISLKGKQKYETHTSEIYTMIFDYTYICYLSQAHILFEAWNVLATLSNCSNAKPPALHYPDVRVSQFYL